MCLSAVVWKHFHPGYYLWKLDGITSPCCWFMHVQISCQQGREGASVCFSWSASQRGSWLTEAGRAASAILGACSGLYRQLRPMTGLLSRTERCVHRSLVSAWRGEGIRREAGRRVRDRGPENRRYERREAFWRIYRVKSNSDDWQNTGQRGGAESQMNSRF